MDEAALYFDQGKNLEEVIEVIQKSVQLMLDERS